MSIPDDETEEEKADRLADDEAVRQMRARRLARQQDEKTERDRVIHEKAEQDRRRALLAAQNVDWEYKSYDQWFNENTKSENPKNSPKEDGWQVSGTGLKRVRNS